MKRTSLSPSSLPLRLSRLVVLVELRLCSLVRVFLCRMLTLCPFDGLLARGIFAVLYRLGTFVLRFCQLLLDFGTRASLRAILGALRKYRSANKYRHQGADKKFFHNRYLLISNVVSLPF
ncbi:hypothetical protein CBM2585_A130130 [Cupriavidus taiwanensis]|nr:hypothetical protein CBM2585_A130130 [Cupriavidus taiwanensis]SOZ05392.1 hypothetical protein CBM2595_A80077 [Cupriavidus taiwanensis]